MKMRKGFTLVELLIVLAVIAALLSVATPLALNAVKKAKASQVAQNFRAIKTAIENWWNTENPDTSNLPNNTNGFKTALEGYINKFPENFDVSIDDNNNGVYQVTITYKGSDIDPDMVLESGVSEATETNNGIELDFKLQKWW